MDVDLRAVKKLRESQAARSALGPIMEAVCTSSADLSRLRVVCDWVQYKKNFREAVAGRPIAEEGTEIAVDLRRCDDLAPDSLAAAVQPAPESVHVVPSLLGSFVTVAVKLVTWLACTVAEPGESATDTLLTGGAGLVEDPPPHPANPATAITHAQIVATFVRTTPRGKAINPPKERSGTGAAF